MRTEEEQRAWEAHPAELAAKLLRILVARTQTPGLAYAAPPAPLGGGYWASLYSFRLANAPAGLSGELVLRVMPTSDEQCLREATIQAAVAAAGFPTPRVHLSAGRDAGLGFPFIVMARAAGKTGLSPWRTPAVLGETMAWLHSLDTKPVSEAIDVLEDVAARTEPLAHGGFAAGLAWLQEHQPQPAARVICHGDFHPFNLLMVDGHVSAVLDWTQALLADPAFDVAYTSQLLALWPIEISAVPRPLGRILGRLAAWRFVHAYRRRARASLDALPWYEALHSFRVLVRVARARMGITLPPLAEDHPWELVAEDAARAFHRHTGIRVELPLPCARPAAS